ncbi:MULTISPECIES: O-antigen ligase family protein [Rhodomicrobium]|uniref:O-antigen ligase family protein n=1 Tax=Rhodomicrobium TaxID=1068 RepID=UPI000F748538|nr:MULTISPECIES: O-antigen ligase family protein [Rhodomicrobium]
MSPADRQSGALLIAAAAMAGSAVVLLAPDALIGIAVLPAVAAAGLLLWGAVRGSRPAVLTILFLAIFMLDAMFRMRDWADKGVDFQVLLKIGAWALMVFVTAVHWQRWLAHVLTPTNIPWVLFLGWLLFTATVSPMPEYSAISAISICAYVLFCAYLFAEFERGDIFAVMVLAITLFCAVSIIVYFAVPEFGRFVYWLNEQLYVSWRLSGIAGTANTMGRLAAFGLILIILYAAEFRRLHWAFVPVCAVIQGAALIMTNSRTSIAMVVVLWAAVYLFQWRKLYLIPLLVSLGLIAAFIVLPGGDETLKMASRSGSADEITSVTGRAAIWAAVPIIIEGHSLTGYGYASSILVLPQHKGLIGYEVSHAHNLVLQLLLTTGWIGVVLFCLSMLVVGLRAAALGERTVLVMLAYVLLNGITESSAFCTLANVCSLAFAVAVTLPPERSPA